MNIKDLHLPLDIKEVEILSYAPERELENWEYEVRGDYLNIKKYRGKRTSINFYDRYRLNGKVLKLMCAPIDMSYFFWNKSELLMIRGFEHFSTRICEDMSEMFYNCKNAIFISTVMSTENVRNMEEMFYGCESLTSLDLKPFWTRNVSNMMAMFQECKSLKSIRFSEMFTTNKVTNMNWMFAGCESLETLDLTSFDTHNVEKMFEMFTGCKNLKDIKVTKGRWEISKHCNTEDMFKGCGVNHLTYVDPPKLELHPGPETDENEEDE